MASRRRGNDHALVVIYWRDIPAQVTAGGRTAGAKVLLDARFQHAIDRAAVVAGLIDTHSYVAQWRRSTEPLAGEAGDSARQRAAQLDAALPDVLLEALVRNGGWTPDPESDVTP